MFNFEKHLRSYAAKDWQAYRNDYDAQAEFTEVATRQTVRGPDQILKLVQGWKAAFADLAGTIKNSAIAGNKAFAEIEWTGTHTGTFDGPFGPVPATGKRGTVSAVLIFTLKGDRIVSAHHYFDLLTVARQLGASARPEVAAISPTTH